MSLFFNASTEIDRVWNPALWDAFLERSESDLGHERVKEHGESEETYLDGA